MGFTSSEKSENIGQDSYGGGPGAFIWVVEVVGELIPLGDTGDHIRKIIIKNRVPEFFGGNSFFFTGQINFFYCFQRHLRTW